jgi:hypothetical protein
MVLPAFTFESVEELPAVEIPADSRQFRALHNPWTPLELNGLWEMPTQTALIYVALGDNTCADYIKVLQTMLEVEVTGELDWNTVTELQRRSLIAPDGEWNAVTVRGIQAALNSGILF